MNQSLQFLNQFPELDEEAKRAFFDRLHFSELDRGILIQDQNRICEHMYFVVQGSLRSFYYRDQKDITVSFALEQEIATAMHSFITRKPSYELIETMEKSVIARITYSDLTGLFDKFPMIERVYRKILERYYIALEDQITSVKFKSARDRYLELLQNRPKVIQKAAVGQIASFLDMSIETLSRIRAKI